MDGFRALNARLQTLVAARQKRLDRQAMVSTVIAVAVLGGVFALVGGLVARRQAVSTARRRARERRYQEGQRDLGTGLQVAHSEPEAHTFLQRHLEHVVPASAVTVLTRHGAANRLRAGTELPAGSPLRDPLAEAEPGSCLAVRLARRRQGSDDYEGVLRCGICHKSAPLTDCTPLVVGGEVIGSVLVAHEAPLTPDADRAIEDSVGQAAPVLANLRNLAIAESRAATDGLTGLPNRRSFEDQLRRMAAQAGRTMQPLSAVALDIDHFKAINDVHGHARGDEVLAQIGSLMPSVLRVSDFVARVGGEEFVALLPGHEPRRRARDRREAALERRRARGAGARAPGDDQPRRRRAARRRDEGRGSPARGRPDALRCQGTRPQPGGDEPRVRRDRHDGFPAGSRA